MSSPALLHHRPGISDTELMLNGYRLSLANFYFRMPDFRSVLNVFTWQFFDVAPDYPRLFEFIEFWQREIESPLHSVEFIQHDHLTPGNWRRLISVSHFPEIKQRD